MEVVDRNVIFFRVVGIAWGGSQPINVLQIRFNPEEDYVPVDNFHQLKNDPWTFWTHDWSPKAPGTYSIRLSVKRSEEHTSELQSQSNLVCRLLLEKKKCS